MARVYGRRKTVLLRGSSRMASLLVERFCTQIHLSIQDICETIRNVGRIVNLFILTAISFQGSLEITNFIRVR
jgi:hypothetical protein